MLKWETPYLSVGPFEEGVNNIADAENSLTRVIAEIKQWMYGKHLKLNEDKTECMIIGNRGIIRRMNGLQSVTVNAKTVDVADRVKDLGVITDKHFTLNDQINAVVRFARFNLRNIFFY